MITTNEIEILLCKKRVLKHKCIPKCPVCGEMPYSTEQCHWCGQHFLQDEEIKKYAEPKIQKGSCPNCGAPIDIHISSYNGHKYFHCDACKMTVME